MNGAAYVEVVQARYLALRGGGLTLSPVDADLIRAWRDQGVPLELALLGLQRAQEEKVHGGRGTRRLSLRRAEAHVLALFSDYARRSGVAPAYDARPPADPPSPTSIAPALLHLLGEARGPAAAAYAAALHALDRCARLAPDEVLRAADEASGLAYLRALARPEQRAVGRIARAGAGPRGDVPRAAHRATLRALLLEAARAHGGLTRPSDLP